MNKETKECILYTLYLLLCFIGCVALFLFLNKSEIPQEEKPTRKQTPQVVYVEVEKIVEVEVPVYVPYEEPFYRNFTEQDEWYLQDIAMREAEGEDVIGQCWVMYAFLCRCEAFGHSIEEEWRSSAFATSMNRSGLTPNENCNRALALIEEGWQPRPLYFGAGYYHDFATPLCEYGGHCFSS